MGVPWCCSGVENPCTCMVFVMSSLVIALLFTGSNSKVILGYSWVVCSGLHSGRAFFERCIMLILLCGFNVFVFRDFSSNLS